MRTLSAFLLASAAAAAAPSAGRAESQAWRFAHPDAQILAGVNFRILGDSEPGKALRDRFASTLGPALMEQADNLLLSSVFDENGKRSDIVILSGKFELAKLRKMASGEGAKMVGLRGLEIAAPPGAKTGDPHLAWMSNAAGATSILIGSRPAITAAADRFRTPRQEPLPETNKLFGRAMEMAPDYPAWVACDSIPAGFAPKAVDAMLDADPDAGIVEGMDLGIRAGATGDINLWFWSNSEATADQLMNHFTASVGTKDEFILKPWIADLKGTIEGSTLALGVPVAGDQFAVKASLLLGAFALPVDTRATPPLPAIRAKLDSSAPMTGLEKVSKDLVPAAPPEPPKPLFVRIAGLDGGDREIPYENRPR